MARLDRWKLPALCLATFMLLLDIMIVQAALPSIQRQLGGDLTSLQWAIDAYTLPLAALIVTLGTVADRIGRRTVFCAGVVVFSAASLACGCAQSMTQLEISRVVQGVGGAAMFATTLALIGQEFTGAERGRAVLAWGSTVGGAVASGSLFGGLITQYASWRWIFLVNVPLGIITVIVTLRAIANGRDESGRRLDVPGLVTLTAALGLFVGGLLRESASDWSSGAATAALVSGGVLLVVFALLQRRDGAMFDRALLADRRVIAVSGATLALGAGMFSVFLYLTVFVQGALHASPLGGGLRLLPATVPIFVVPFVLRKMGIAPVSGRIIGIGLTVITAGLLAMTWASADASWTRLLPGLILTGLGIGIANASVAATALAVVPPNRTGLASGLSNTCRLGGVAIGIAALGAVFRAGIDAHLPSGPAAALVAAGKVGAAARGLTGGAAQAEAAFTHGMHLLLVTAAGIVAVGAVAAFRGVRIGQPAAAPAPVVVPAAAPVSA